MQIKRYFDGARFTRCNVQLKEEDPEGYCFIEIPLDIPESCIGKRVSVTESSEPRGFRFFRKAYFAEVNLGQVDGVACKAAVGREDSYSRRQWFGNRHYYRKLRADLFDRKGYIL